MSLALKPTISSAPRAVNRSLGQKENEEKTLQSSSTTQSPFAATAQFHATSGSSASGSSHSHAPALSNARAHAAHIQQSQAAASSQSSNVSSDALKPQEDLGLLKDKASLEINKHVKLLKKEIGRFICFNRSLKIEKFSKLIALQLEIQSKKNKSEINKLLQQNLNDLVLIQGKNSRTKNLIYRVINDGPNRISVLPKVLLTQVISSYLEPQCASHFATALNSSKADLPHIKKTTFDTYGKQQCREMGCEPRIFSLVDKDNRTDYKLIAQRLKAIRVPARKDVKPWMVLLLSGRDDLISQNLEEIKNEVLADGTNTLHLAALGGSLVAMEYVCTQFDIPRNSIDHFGKNALHFACFGGSIIAMEHVRTHWNILKESVDNWGRNALHFACWGGSIQAMEHVKSRWDISEKSVGKSGRNALHFACWGGSIAAMEHVRTKWNLSKNSVDMHGVNALHFACWGGSIAAMEHVRTKWNISKNSKDNGGLNVLHFACWSGSIAAMKYASKVWKILPTTSSPTRRNTLHSACFSGSVEAIRFVIDEFGVDPNSTDAQGLNTLHYATASGYLGAVKYAHEELNIPRDSVFQGGGNCVDGANYHKLPHLVRFFEEEWQLRANL